MIMDGMNTSIMGRAIDNGMLTVNAVNIRDFANNKHMKVDDYTYGGGAGMLMQAAPVCDAYAHVERLIGHPARVVYMTPAGRVFNQQLALELSQEEDLVFLCGHYEGIDERALEKIVTDYVSIGDYVLTGGELPAMVVMDAVARLVPGVLNNKESAEFESFHDNLLEYPQYTRPEVYDGMAVPEVLLCGDHARVEQWRLEQSIDRTRRFRPDLYEKYLAEHGEIVKKNKKKITEKADVSMLDLDPGTGLLNKRAIEMYARSLIESRPEYDVAIAVIDIDDFKDVNDTYGHQFGDDVITTVAHILQETVRDRGIAGRIGGDEFFIVLKGVPSWDDRKNILRGLRMNIEKAYKGKKGDFAATCSMGCASYPEDADNYDDLFMLADRLLYLAKEKGKNRYVLYQDELHHEYAWSRSRKSLKSVDMVNADKLEVINRVVDELYSNPGLTLSQICDIFAPSFELDDVSIYKAGDWSRDSVWGHCGDHDFDGAYMGQEDYQSCFDKDNVFAVSNYVMLSERCPAMRDAVRNDSISSTVHYRVVKDGDVKGVIAFNRTHSSKKWASSDANWLCTMGHIMADRYFN
jgi:tRNA (guanine37-N1)-methyltransferase